MDFFEVVKNRYSYRMTFDPAAPSLEDLKKIVQAGLDAPTGKNAQTTGFLIIKDPDIISRIQAMPGGNKAMKTAQAYIAAHISSDPEKIYEGHDFEIEDCASAVENMLLASTALSYASVWIDGWLRVENRADELGRICGLDSSRTIRIILPIGKPLEKQVRREKMKFDERVRII